MKTANFAVIAGLNALLASLNTGGAGRIDVMDGSMPADVSVAISAQNVLGSVTLPATAFPTATDGTSKATATANAITAGVAIAVGTAVWFRAYNGAGTAVIDGTAGLVGDSPELVLDDKTFEIGDNVSVSSWVVDQAE